MWIIGGILFFAVVIITVTLLSRVKPGIDYKELIKAKDETIQAVIREKDAYRKWKDEAIQDLNEKDSLLQLKVKTNTIRYEKIPVTISNLSDDELRRAVEEYR